LLAERKGEGEQQWEATFNMRRKQLRRQREAAALELLRYRRHASALDIGRAAARGESGGFRISREGYERIGLSVAIALVQSGRARATSANYFTLMPDCAPRTVLWGHSWDEVDAATAEQHERSERL
jgi:hypothetical protein